MEMADVLRQRRAELGMSQVDLATAAGVDKRQIRRYEAGEQQPVLSVAVAIANALKISVGELAGIPSHKVNLSGDWWTSWQSFKDSQEVVAVQPVQLRQQGDLISLQTIARGRPVEDGGYHWRGELRVWDNEVLMGWYAADDGSIRSKGTLYFVLHPHGQRLDGRWVGMSHDGKIVTGFGGMARTEDEARDTITKLREQKEAT
jgi:transcriptional regulator with XRE-family HTH domain